MAEYCDPSLKVSSTQRDAAQMDKGAASVTGTPATPDPTMQIESGRDRAIARGETAFNMYS